MSLTKSLIVLDTNILVRLIRNDAVGTKVATDYALSDRPERPLISIVTAGEIQSLALKLGWGPDKRAAVTDLLRQLVIVDLHQGGIVTKYAEIDHFCEKLAKPARRIQHNDMWIAATASEVDAALLTTDSDFDHLHGRFLEVVSINPRTGDTR